MSEPRPKLSELQEALLRQGGRPRRKPRFRWLRNALLFLCGVLIAFALCYSSVCRAFRVAGQAMRPTLQEGDRVLVATLAYGDMNPPGQGDIVLFRSPPQLGADDTLIVKRVVGIPGDELQVRDGKLWRNDRIVDEPYIREAIGYDWGPVTCTEGHLLVLGDNRNESIDSHNWTAREATGKLAPAPLLPAAYVEGRVFFVIYPPHRVGRL